LEAKYARYKEGDTTALIDPEGYNNFVVEKERAFRRELLKQRGSVQ
jgi:metallo-beta-lactamase class B